MRHERGSLRHVRDPVKDSRLLVRTNVPSRFSGGRLFFDMLGAFTIRRGEQSHWNDYIHDSNLLNQVHAPVQFSRGTDIGTAEEQRLVAQVLAKDRKATAEFVARCADWLYSTITAGVSVTRNRTKTKIRCRKRRWCRCSTNSWTRQSSRNEFKQPWLCCQRLMGSPFFGATGIARALARWHNSPARPKRP